MKRKRSKIIVRKISYAFLAIMTFFSQANFSYMVYALADNVNYDTVSVADPDTSNIEDLYDNSKSDDGMIMTDKSVDHVKEDLFDITLSALGQGFETSKTVETNKKLDVVFVLDVSGSMEDNDRYISMVNAVNTAIGTIMSANDENRIGVVTFSSSSNTLLSLDSYSTTNQNNQNDYLTYKEGWGFFSTPSISTSSNLRDSNNNRVNKSTDINGGTYTQSGMARGANLLINNDDTKDRVPVIILLSDGEPTYGTTKYNNVGNHNLGSGSSSTGQIGYNTILTGKSYKDKVETKYGEDCKYYTIGLDVTSNFGKAVLNPTTENVNNLSYYGNEGSLRNYLNNHDGDYNYVDSGYSGSMSSEELNAIFEAISEEIVKGTSSPFGGTDDTRALTFSDTLGRGIEVKNAPIVTYNGLTYGYTDIYEDTNYTAYIYNHDVTNSDGNTVNLSNLQVRVYNNSDGTQTISFVIPKNLFPFITRDKDNNVSPIRLTTRVGLSDEAIENSKTGDVFYTNNFTDSKTTATFSPVKDNPYYYENISYEEDGSIISTPKYQNKTLTKEENVTNTNSNYYESTFNKNTGVVTTILGNNGKVVLDDPDEVTTKTVTKEWNDANNQDGIRPDSIEVELLANGKGTGKKVTLSDDNNWTYEFTNLPKYTNNKEINYTVKEITKVDGYQTTYSEDGLTITNTHEVEKTTRSVTKVWKDNNDQDGLRPDSITVALSKDGVRTGDTAVLNESNDWSYTFTNLDKYSNGKEINYTIDEVDVPTGYSKDVTVNDDGSTTISNTHTTDRVTKTAIKVWNDNNNQDGIRPNYVVVRLYANGEATDSTATLSASNNWRHNFTNLEKNENGKEITYTVKEETKVDGYTTTYSKDGLTITNTHTPEVRDIKVVKVWDDANNQDGIRPDTLMVTLYANGNEKATKELTADNWSYTFKDLPKYENGKEITYTVSESAVDGYTLTNNKMVGDTITLTNSYTPEVTSKTVTKVWNDNNNQDGIRPDSVTIDLYNGDNLVKTVELNTSNDWTYDFTNLPKYENGKEIVYTAKEVNVPEGYEVSYSKDTYTITNTHNTYTTKKTVTKVWDDENNIEGFRPNSITVELLDNNNEVVKEATLSNANNWTYTFTNLSLNEDGKEIKYTVREKEVPEGYTVSYDQDTLTITNTKEVTKTEKTITKIWNDNNNQDGIRPDSVNVTLYANGNKIDTYTLTKYNNYTLTVPGLQKHANGKLINYTIEEETVTGYTASYDQETLTVTNTHTPEVRSINITKEWNDANNQDGMRPGSVTIYLLANNQKVLNVTLSEANNWTTTIDNLPVYENGEKITYTLKEENVTDGYTVSYEYNDNNLKAINTHEVEKTSITAEKIWNDMNNQDGLRSDEILVNLLANGEYYQTIRLNTANGFKATIDNLNKYLNGNIINYTLEEISKINGYETTYSSDTFTIVNNHRILTVTKTVDKTTVNPGDTLTYTITVSNDGDVEANDIILIDRLDTNLEFISSEGGAYDPSTHTVIYKIDALNPNEKKTFTLVTRVKDDVTSDTTINNTALVLGNDNDEEVPSNEVTTTVVEPPKDEVIEIVNPETSDNINIIYLTALVDMLLLGFFVRRKREN